MTDKEKITFKYHRHIEDLPDGYDKKHLMYYTLEDVNKCMDEYVALSDAKILFISDDQIDSLSDVYATQQGKYRVASYEAFRDGANTIARALQSNVKHKNQEL